MNAAQQQKYGPLNTWTDVLKRWCQCPYCDYRASIARRGRGNARATASVVQGIIMAHMREHHASALTEHEDERGRRTGS